MGSGRGGLIRQTMERVLERHRDDGSGAVASYIPELALADPRHFGIALATVDGTVYSVGDASVPFTIQSISKPFVYGMALEDHGVDTVLSRVGVEPSGDAFNSIVMDETHNRPMNPMVNAGAIASAALVSGSGFDQRWSRVLATFGRYAGRSLVLDQKVYESERDTGHRNRAIAFLELSSGMIEEPVLEHLDLYFRQCSILVTAEDLAVMGATLANGGVNPVTGDRAVSDEHATRVLSVMATCGMYDWSGEWMYRVGLPAKSGVGGGILVVLPGQLAIATFSPPLDDHGNSCRGVAACEELARELSLHLLDNTAAPPAVVRRHYDARAVSSKRLRNREDRARLARDGAAIQVLELQGDLTFVTAERLLREVEPLLGASSTVILDLRRVGHANVTAANLLGRLWRSADGSGTVLTVASASDEVVAALAEAGWPASALDGDVDDALEEAEDALLGIDGSQITDGSAEVPLGAVDVLVDATPDEVGALEAVTTVATFAPGERIIEAGTPADRLYFLTAGRASVHLPLADGERARRLRTFSAGVAFGESALFSGARRTADVVADTAVACRVLTIAGLDEVSTTRPGLRATLLTGVGRNLATQLARAMDEIRSLDT
jgi:glutaminase